VAVLHRAHECLLQRLAAVIAHCCCRTRGLFARALVWGDVDPHCGGLGARNADGGAIERE